MRSKLSKSDILKMGLHSIEECDDKISMEKAMRDYNADNNYSMVNRLDDGMEIEQKGFLFSDADICWAMFMDYLREQCYEARASVAVSHNLYDVYETKYIYPLIGRTPTEDEAEMLNSIEGILKRLGLSHILEKES